MTLNPVFTALWLAWGLFTFGAEFLAPDVLAFTRPASLVWFVALETAGLVRKAPGDLLSEHVWAFYAGHLARVPLVLGMVAYIVVALWEVGTGLTLMVGPIPAARFVLGAGVGGWLVPHLLFEGKYG